MTVFLPYAAMRFYCRGSLIVLESTYLPVRAQKSARLTAILVLPTSGSPSLIVTSLPPVLGALPAWACLWSALQNIPTSRK